jgi:hypothetical protein
MIRGQLTCGGSGLSGKTITLTSSKLSYVGAFGTAKTREDGTFSASTRKPLTTVSAWYLGGPDEGGIASKVVTPHGGPQSSNTASTPQESSNTGNGATLQKSSNTGNGRTNIFAPTGTCHNCFGFNSPQKQQSSNTVAQGGPSGGNVVQGTPQKSSETSNAAQEKGGTIKVKCTNGYMRIPGVKGVLGLRHCMPGEEREFKVPQKSSETANAVQGTSNGNGRTNILVPNNPTSSQKSSNTATKWITVKCTVNPGMQGGYFRIPPVKGQYGPMRLCVPGQELKVEVPQGRPHT